MALARGLSGGVLPRLEDLSLTFLGDEGAMELMGGQLTPLPNLRTLCLRASDMTAQGLEVLVAAITNGAFRFLEQLDLSCNDFGDEGIACLTQALQAGAMLHLLKLSLDSMKIGEGGLATLCEILSDKTIAPRLCEVDVDNGDGRQRLKEILDVRRKNK